MSIPTGVKDRTSGSYWLVVGGILIAVAVVVLALLTPQQPGIAWTAIVVDVLLFAAMVVTRFVVRPILARQWTLAICLVAASVLSLGALYLIVLAER
jgi:isoprenylcysteine carboxyl methyltransferase (ICMT) family protein YpbQ